MEEPPWQENGSDLTKIGQKCRGLSEPAADLPDYGIFEI
jgi:hypothetical protein